tara:strand:+ start:318 stop:560 length:243 start_codon:yes stop_codon:yes gene_type:complete
MGGRTINGQRTKGSTQLIANRNSKIWDCGAGLGKTVGGKNTLGMVMNSATSKVPGKWNCDPKIFSITFTKSTGPNAGGAH